MDIINSVQINKCRAKRENICKNEKENKNQKKRKFILHMYDYMIQLQIIFINHELVILLSILPLK